MISLPRIPSQTSNPLRCLFAVQVSRPPSLILDLRSNHQVSRIEGTSSPFNFNWFVGPVSILCLALNVPKVNLSTSSATNFLNNLDLFASRVCPSMNWALRVTQCDKFLYSIHQSSIRGRSLIDVGLQPVCHSIPLNSHSTYQQIFWQEPFFLCFFILTRPIRLDKKCGKSNQVLRLRDRHSSWIQTDLRRIKKKR